MPDEARMHASGEMLQAAAEAFRMRDLAQAESLCQRILRTDARNTDALHILGLVLAETGRLQHATDTLREALDLQPGNAVIWANLGGTNLKAGQLDEAIACYQRAIGLRETLPEAHYNLSMAYRQLGQFDKAIAAACRATQLRPTYANAHFTLGELMREQGRLTEAVAAYQAAIRLDPDWPEAHYYLGSVWLQLGRPVDAADHFRTVLRLNPTSSSAQHSLGHALRLLGRVEEARAAYTGAMEKDNKHGQGDPMGALVREFLAELIPPDTKYIADYAARVDVAIRAFMAEPCTLDLSKLHTDAAIPDAMLVYYGCDVRPIFEKYAQVIGPHIPRRPHRARHGKPKLGIVATDRAQGVFARCWGGIAERLSRDLFEIRLVCSPGGANFLQTVLRIPPQEYLPLPTDIDEAARLLHEQEFDWIHYWEIGTDAINYYLPFFRPAIGQSDCWGWPVTSGNPNVDSYLSCEQLEPPEGPTHYTEQLILLKHLPTYYVLPSAPHMALPRSRFGLEDNQRLYLCTQNLRKYHPDFDPILGAILRSDPQGIVLIIADAQPPITELLLKRFQTTIPDVVSRIRVMPRMELADYLALVSLANVALDTLHYGGGANTVYDAVAVGTPIVTLPGEFHRSRWAAAVNRRLGLPQLIAATPEEYVAKAAEVASNPDLRQALRKQILEAGAELFEDMAVVREHEEYFSQAIAATRAENRG